MGKKKRILLIEPIGKTSSSVVSILEKQDFTVNFAEEGERALSMIYNDPPDLILVDMDSDKGHLGDLCVEIKSDSIYGHLPLVAMFQKGGYADGEVIRWKVDDFVFKPVDPDEILLRIQLIFDRGERNLDANALTRLPGNNTIISQIQSRIDKKASFALAYLDIDNFKPFNDRYGFSRGDEVLRMTARLIGNVVTSVKGSDSFVGHVGGDDFVFIVSPGVVKEVCEKIISNFNQIIPIFYDEEDRTNGYIESIDRQEQRCRFSLMTVSIGVGLSDNFSKLSHYGEIAAVASEMKKFAKNQGGGGYRVDRRKH